MKKNFIILFTALSLFASCTKESPVSEKWDREEMTITDQNAYLDEFSRILSMAVEDNYDLRVFLKEEALRQFDKNYDIFYPFVKDKEITHEITFREALLRYTTPERLNKIEAACPLLNILIPDWSWIGGFSAELWDVTDDFATVSPYNENREDHVLIHKGDSIMTLKDSQFPNFPILLVNNSKRIRIVEGTTKSSAPSYEYVNKCFDNSSAPMTKRSWHYTTVDYPIEGTSDFVPFDEISPILIQSYNEFKLDTPDGACQRDYVYFGMDKHNTNCGEYHNYIRERFYRFKVNTNAIYNVISDQTEDPSLHEKITITGKKNDLSNDELFERIWNDGSFVFQFDVFIGNGESNVLNESYTYPVYGKDLFDLSKVHCKYLHQTTFARGWYIYTFEPEDLVPKWVVFKDPIFLPEWNIADQSNTICIYASEFDTSKAKEWEDTQTFKYSQNFSWKLDGEISGKDKVNYKLGFGLNGGNVNEKSETVRVKYTTTETSENIGHVHIPYVGKILKNPSTKVIDGQTENGYDVQSISMGAMSLTFLPTDIR